MFAKKIGLKDFGLSLLLVFCLGLCAFAIPASAQIGNASLGGTVMDPSGGVIGSAELRLTNKATGFEARAVSNERGEYTFRNLTPGTYDLKISKAGFENYIQRGIVITINESAHADAALKVGAASETVTVEGENTLINSDNATLQGGVDPQTLQSLPLIVSGKPRSSASLAVLLPGVTTGSGNEAFNARINGGTQSGDEALLDGATMQEGFMSQSGMVAIQGDFQMSPDMVQEVKVITSNYDAQYGSSTSSQIAVVTKSGGSTYHGAAFGFYRDKIFNAAPWNGTCPPSNPNCDRRPGDVQKNYGANFGGPVKIPHLYHGTSKHHSFFYFNWEAYHQVGGSNTAAISIPSVAERGDLATGKPADFSDWALSQGKSIYMPGSASAACQSAAGVGPGKQFPGNIIPVACFSPIASAYLKLLPQPTNTNAIDNYLPPPVPDTLINGSNVYMFRIDHNYADSDHFYFTFWRQFAAINIASQLPRAIANESPTNPQNSPIFRFNWEHIFSNVMTNHMTLGYLNRNEGYGSLNLDQIGKLPGVNGVASNTNALPDFQFFGCDACGFTQISNSNGHNAGNVTTRPTWVINDIASRVIGHHTVTFGGEWRNVEGNIHQGTNESGHFFFGIDTTSVPGVNSGSPVAAFLLGAVSNANVDFRTVSAWYPRQKVYALHVSDTWRVTPKLSVNYGLRWDEYTPSREKFNHLSFFDASGTNPDAGGLAGSLAFAGKGSGCQPACFGADFPEKTWKKGFAPRLGIAYSYDQKTVIRSGYGVFFAQAFYPGWGGGMSLDGYNLNQSFSTAGSPGSTPAFYLDGGFPQTFTPPPFISAGFDNGRNPLYRPVNANRRPYSQQWNLTIERQLPHEVFMSVAYVGNKGTRLGSSLQPLNVLNPSAPTIQALGSQLQDVFTSDAATDGVPSPYTGWYQQMTNAGCSPTVAQALVPYPQYCNGGSVSLQGMNENVGNSTYHSFQVKAEKRYSKGLYMLVSYTNSKLITDAADNTQSGGGGTWNGTQGVVSPFEKRRARALAPDDVPQVLSAAFVYDLPFGKGKKYLHDSNRLNYLAGGWQFSPILRYSRGTLFWFRSAFCNSNNLVPQFGEACLVGILPGEKPFLQDPNNFDPNKGCTALTGPNCAPLFNSAAFELSCPQGAASADPKCSTFGYNGSGARVSNLRGPNFKNVDFSIIKNTRFGERLNFQIRAEFYNAFNLHYFIDGSNFNQSGNNAFHNDVSDGSFGTWNSAVSGPRVIQFGARVEF